MNAIIVTSMACYDFEVRDTKNRARNYSFDQGGHHFRLAMIGEKLS